MKPISEMTPMEIRRAILVRIFDVDDSKLWTATDNALEINSDTPIAPPPADCCALHYESEIGPAFEVVAKMREKGWHTVAAFQDFKDNEWHWRFGRYEKSAQYWCRHASLPRAICLAALEAIGSAK